MKKLSKIITAFALAMLASSHLSAAEWASLKGQFLYGKEGTKVPKALQITPTKDAEVCGDNKLYDEELTVDEKTRGIKDVILWAYKPKPIHPSYTATEDATVRVDNKGLRFDPHVSVVRTGQKFEVGNVDPVGHNSLINFLKNQPINPIIPANGKIDVDLKAAELIPIAIACSIHPHMKGFVLVQDHPYMAVTDAEGKFEMKDLPAGKLTLKVWHEKSGWIKSVEIDNKKEDWNRGRYALTLKGGQNQEHTYVVDPKTF